MTCFAAVVGRRLGSGRSCGLGPWFGWSGSYDDCRIRLTSRLFQSATISVSEIYY